MISKFCRHLCWMLPFTILLNSCHKPVYNIPVSIDSPINEECDDISTHHCFVTNWHGNKSKVISFTWDDNHPGAIEVASVFDKFNLDATFFINTGVFYNWKFYVKHPFIKRKYRRILRNGHEIGTHTHNNVNLLSIPRSEIEDELVLSSNSINEIFGFIPASMSHPTSHYDEYIDSLVKNHYLDSRYSMVKDLDSTVRFMQIRKSYDFLIYKQQLDAFIKSKSSKYIYAGHQLNNKGYEPINSSTLDSLLRYITNKYDDVWITTFSNMTIYERIRNNICINNSHGKVILSTHKIAPLLDRYSNLSKEITLCFPSVLLDFSSSGIIAEWYSGGNSYVTIDLGQSCILKYRESGNTKMLPTFRNQ